MVQRLKTSAPRLYGRRQLAELFDVNAQTVTKWAAAGCPVARHGSRGRRALFNVAKVVAWRVDTAREKDDGPLNLGAERAALARAQRLKLEREAKVRAGELIERARVEGEFADIATFVKTRLRAIPSAVAVELVSAAASGPAAVSGLLLRRVDAALHELARHATVTDEEFARARATDPADVTGAEGEGGR